MKFVDLSLEHKLIAKKIQFNIEQTLESNIFINGAQVELLEERLAQYVGTKHCIGVSSGTDALVIALMAIGVGRDDEVITTPFSFIATSSAILLVGAKPVYVDIEPSSYNIDPTKIEQVITKKSKAIIPVNLYGQPADYDSINSVAKAYNLKVIEDGAQSFGATYKGCRSLGLSTIGAASFYPSKPLGCYGDGGGLFTNDDNLAAAAKSIRNHGQEGNYNHVRLGLNGRLDAIQAAVLLAKLDIIDEIVALRNEKGAYYSERLANFVLPPKVAKYNSHVYGQYTVKTDKREQLAQFLKNENIPTAIHYPVPIHLQPMFKMLGYMPNDFPVSEESAKKVLSLPFGPYISRADQDCLIAKIEEFFNR